MERCLNCKLPIYYGTWGNRPKGDGNSQPLLAEVVKWRHEDGLAPCNEPSTHAEPGGKV